MKRFLLIFLLAINLNLYLYSQNKLDDYKRLIDSTIIIKSIETYRDFQGELNKKNETDNWKDYISDYKHYIDNIYLIDNNNQPYLLLASKDTNIKFKQIDIYNKKNKQLLKEGIDIWKIIPNLESNQLKITIINFKVTCSRNNYQFANGGGTIIVFEYSCEEKKWILISNKSTSP